VGTVDAVLIPVIRGSDASGGCVGARSTRQVRLDWEQVKTQVMREAVLQKFLTHSDIQAILISTGDELIVENSQADYYLWWRKDWSNHLGKIS